MTEQESFLRRAMEDHGPCRVPVALCRTQSVPDAQDVSGRVFAASGSGGGYGGPQDRLRAWLLRVTLNRCADLHRFRLRRPVVPLEEAADAAAAEDGAAELWEAVARLPEKLRTAVHLHYAEGYPPRRSPPCWGPGGYGPYLAPPGPIEIEGYVGRQ